MLLKTCLPKGFLSSALAMTGPSNGWEQQASLEQHCRDSIWYDSLVKAVTNVTLTLETVREVLNYKNAKARDFCRFRSVLVGIVLHVVTLWVSNSATLCQVLLTQWQRCAMFVQYVWLIPFLQGLLVSALHNTRMHNYTYISKGKGVLMRVQKTDLPVYENPVKPYLCMKYSYEQGVLF